MIIRQALKEDMPKVLELIKELAEFENELDQVEVTVDELVKDGFGEKPQFTCFVAEEDNKIEGVALTYLRYSTWKGIALHLEDLIVNRNSRGKGIGTLLLNEVILYGKKLGVKRIGWEVLNWNSPAKDFYKKKGASIKEDWQVVQLNEEGIKNYIANI